MHLKREKICFSVKFWSLQSKAKVNIMHHWMCMEVAACFPLIQGLKKREKKDQCLTTPFEGLHPKS